MSNYMQIIPEEQSKTGLIKHFNNLREAHEQTLKTSNTNASQTRYWKNKAEKLEKELQDLDVDYANYKKATEEKEENINNRIENLSKELQTIIKQHKIVSDTLGLYAFMFNGINGFSFFKRLLFVFTKYPIRKLRKLYEDLDK